MNIEFNSYSLLSRLPLFQGMSGAEFDELISHLPFDFSKVDEGKIIVGEGELAQKLVFVVNGELTSEVFSADKGYSITEYLSVPCVLQPERLFGLTQRYSRTFKSVSKCSLLRLDKRDVISLTSNSEVFRLNVLNLLCTTTQKLQRITCEVSPSGIRQKIFSFVKNRCVRPAGRKVVNIGMVRLGHEIGESRLNVSRELKAMHREGLIEQKKKMFVIPALERLS